MAVFTTYNRPQRANELRDTKQAFVGPWLKPWFKGKFHSKVVKKYVNSVVKRVRLCKHNNLEYTAMIEDFNKMQPLEHVLMCVNG